jgi:hypothetical protein
VIPQPRPRPTTFPPPSALTWRLLLLAGFLLVTLPCLAQPPEDGGAFAAPKPLHIGVGGDYPNGLDGQLSARGYPWGRIFPWELNQPEALRKYDVILLSCVPETVSGIDSTLIDWMKAGGHAYVETWAAQNRFPLQSLVNIYSNAPTLGDVVLTDPSHPIAQGLDPAKPFDMHHLQGLCVWPRDRDAGRVIARYCLDKGSKPIEKSPAIIEVPVGEGKLIYSAAPVAFARFHRGRSSEGLLLGIINYLLPDGPAPRLLFTEAANTAPPGSGARIVLPESERDADDEPPPPPAPPAPPTPEPGAMPDGFELIDCPAEEPYDVLAQVAPDGQLEGEPTTLALDGRFDAAGKARRPCAWLTLDPARVELRFGKEAKGRPVAAADWRLPGEGGRLLIRRGLRTLSVIGGAAELLRASTGLTPGGAFAVHAGSVGLVQPLCQPAAPAVFDDDFMREPDSPTPWTPVSGAWRNLGVGNEEYSVNGFHYVGKSDQTPALATAGDWFWEDYWYSAAVQLASAGAQVGLCALVQDNGDYVAFTADPAGAEGAKLRLVRRLAGSDTLLAEIDGGLALNQWYRLGMRMSGGTIEAVLDGRQVLSCPNPEVRGGYIGLLVRNGSARFDDAVVRPNSEPMRELRDEGSPLAELPVSLGPHDSLTWASPATPWEADPERPSLLWHDGFFPRDFDLSLKVRPVAERAMRRFILAPSFGAPEDQRLAVTLLLEPGSAAATVALQRPAGKPASKRVKLQDDATLEVTRRADRLVVLWCGAPLLKVDNAGVYRRAALEVFGPPVRAKDLTAQSASARDYVFGVAPTDWWVSSGEWQVSARWACDDRWSWLAGWGTGDAAIWSKRRFDGDQAVDFWVGVKMTAPGGAETQRCRDYNLVICGDQQNPRSGYSFILGGDGGVKTQLLRNGQVVAEAPTIRVPAGYNVHHCWFRVRASRIGNVISYDFERRPVFRYEDPDPLPGGYVGLWTRNSGILIPRVTIWGSEG